MPIASKLLARVQCERQIRNALKDCSAAIHAAFALIVAAGVYVALVRGGMWGIVALVVGILIGAVLRLMGFGMAGGEIGVALSVILIDGLVIVEHRNRLSWLKVGLALAGVLHGHAYAESVFGAVAATLGGHLVVLSRVQLGVASAAFLMHRRLIATRETWTRPISSALGATSGVSIPA